MTVESLLLERETLLNQILNLEAMLRAKDERAKSFENFNEQLQEAIRLLQHRKFAPKSEKMPTEDQLHMFDEIEVEAGNEQAADESEQLGLVNVQPHKRKKPKRKPLPKELPREDVLIELPVSERICPNDGTELKVIDKEISERIDVVPMQMKVIRTIRNTYACPCCATFVKTAAVPPSLVPKGIATEGTLAFIATAKFCDGMSLYHIEKMFERNGVELSRGSMAHWMIRAAEQAQPILNLLEDSFFESDYAQMDETHTQVLKEPGKKPQTKSFMWVRAKPFGNKIVLFDYDSTRAAKVAQRLLEEFTGRLQCDGYVGYDPLEQNPRIIRHGCMAHARRKFFEATKATKSANIAKHALKLIQKLYRIEEEVRGKPSDEIFRKRKEHSVPVLKELREWVEKNFNKVPPKSPTGKALSYLRNEWVPISRYVEDGRVYIDNNFIENKIRPFAIGRKRWLFSDTVDGAKASAALYSLVETAKVNNVEPYKYLRHIFRQLPAATTLSDFESLLPWNVAI